MKNNHANVSPQDGDTRTGACWYRINPMLKWMLACALGFYGALLLEPETQHWIMAHQFDAVKAIAQSVAGQAVPLLACSALLVSALAAVEVRRAMRSKHRPRAVRVLRVMQARLSRTCRLTVGAV